jgi:hypothetical protein
MQDLPNSLEQAIRYRVSQGAVPVNIYTGADDDGKKIDPSLIIYAESGNESPLGSGNFYVTVNCELRAQSTECGLPAFRTLANQVFGTLMVDGLPASLSTEGSNLHVFGIQERTFSTGLDESRWLSTLKMTMYCCLTDLT